MPNDRQGATNLSLEKLVETPQGSPGGVPQGNEWIMRHYPVAEALCQVLSPREVAILLYTTTECVPLTAVVTDLKRSALF